MKRHSDILSFVVAALLLAAGGASPSRASVDKDVIRLGSAPAGPDSEQAAEAVEIGEPRRGFDYESFESRFESLWFQRKTLLANGREEEAGAQLEQIRAFCAEEGIKRLEHLAGALIAESERFAEEGNDLQALASLRFAEVFDPGRPQTHVARAHVYWKTKRAVAPAIAELVAALRASLVGSIHDLRLVHRVIFVVAIGLILASLALALLMLLRHQTAFRHEAEEWASQFLGGSWPAAVGWALLGLPLLTWVGAGWAVAYWLAITFRFMNRSERGVTVALLIAGLIVVPGYGIAVGLYGTTADPAVRTTLTSVGGEYDPDRIVKLRELVDSHPDDPVYRFLLAGLYKNGRFFEESFEEYKKVLELNPTLVAAHVNIGNIFYTTGQYAEAIANYRRAVDLDSRAFAAYFNLHLAQSENFRFTAADESLNRARGIDANRVARLLSASGDRPAILEGSLEMASLWESAVDGRTALRDPEQSSVTEAGPASGLINPFSVVSMLALLACGMAAVITATSPPARRCIRCGNAFCHHCKSGREAREYCSQCMHLYVLRDGLAPATKQRKIYEVEAFERRTRRLRWLASILLPGAVHVLRGKTFRGMLLVLAWCLAWIAVRPDMLPVSGFAGLSMAGDVLAGAAEVPVSFQASPLALVALLTLPLIWLTGNLWLIRRTES